MAVDLERVQAIAERVAASQGLELVEVEMRGGGKARMLRIFRPTSPMSIGTYVLGSFAGLSLLRMFGVRGAQVPAANASTR